MRTEKEKQVLQFVFELLCAKELITMEEYQKIVARIVEEESYESLHL